MMTESKTTDKTQMKTKTNGPSNFSIFPSRDFLTEQSENILTGLFGVRIKMALLKSSANPKSLQGRMDAFTPYLTIQVRLSGLTDEILPKPFTYENVKHMVEEVNEGVCEMHESETTATLW